MIQEKDAIFIANEKLASITHSVPGGVKLLEDAIIRKEYGWVFFYQSTRFLESGDPLDALGGNGPIVVLRNGTVTVLPSSRSQDETLRMFEESLYEE